MSKERLEEEIKTRVPAGTKSAFDAIAEDRHLSTADIVREALREYLDRRKVDEKAGENHPPQREPQAA